ncbi:MAG: DUF1638 domain-containing protein [Blautia sp.]|nr:DUF1638 domain-containing protein [Blautia sp.]
MNAVILSCTTLQDYVHAAQVACHTSFPVVWLDRFYHVEPQRMRQHILDTMETLPEEVDTVLVAMGFCGGSWQDVVCTRKVVIPRVDDCVSLVMTTSEELNPCTKEMGHMYVFGDGDEGGFSIGGIYEGLVREHGEETAEIVFDMMFENYRNVDIVDTGLYDCYDPAFVEKVQKDADRIHADLDFVPGSNLLLEKLVSGRWDEQFVVVEPGTNITQGTFF